jgi:four helix bundle protein
MKITNFRELNIYEDSMKASIEIFELSRHFPKEEKYSLIDQIRRSSRSVCANIAEAWRKRRYRAAFISKLNDAETEAYETQVWLEFAHECGYLSNNDYIRIVSFYNGIIARIIKIMGSIQNWILG